MGYLPVTGEPVSPDKLAIPRARAVADLLRSGIAYCSLVECYRTPDAETVVCDFDVQRCQHPVWTIRHEERIAATFKVDDDWYPEVVSLREDFPHAPHQNLRDTEYPRSLCLYGESWDEVKVQWTPIRFIDRIRWWLRQTAAGKLHRADQPLESLIFGTGNYIVLPPDLHTESPDSDIEKLSVFLQGKRTLVALRSGSHFVPAETALNRVALFLRCQPQPHGVIRRTPHTLKDLHDLLQFGGIDLLDILRERLKTWEEDESLKLPLILVVAMPKQRVPGGPVEITELWAFSTLKPVLQIGIEIGSWTNENGKRGLVLGADTTKQGQNIQLVVLRPVSALSRDSAAALSGLGQANSANIAAIGVGSLGSQLMMNLARSGFGKWTIIDEDTLLPHNTARHDLNGQWVGIEKATAMAVRIRYLLNEVDAASGLVMNVLHPGNDKPKLDDALNHADMILDMAVSIPVSRHLSLDVASNAQRVSLFLNPRGTDLVMLAEDAARTISLDVLEMQYYRAIINVPVLEKHLAIEQNQLRYGRSCRDVTFQVSQDSVAQHAAIGSRAVRQVVGSEQPRICIWQIHENDSTTTHINVPVLGVHVIQAKPWTVKVDNYLLEKMAALRSGKLPKETGGVLIGSFDMARKTIYAVDTVPAPPDSEEFPTFFIRGSATLRENIETIVTQTSGNLNYIGEWHSHPKRCSCRPSGDDLKVFGWLTAHMARDGFPAVMSIIGDKGSAWYVGTTANNFSLRLDK